jgi:hypothetical protein
MKWILTTACVAAISVVSLSGADAKGCIKGAIVGGVAGHMAVTENWALRPAA